MKPLKTAYELLAGATRATPPELRYGLARTAGSTWYFASPQQRRNAHSNYAAVLRPPPRDREVRRVVRRAFQNYGCMLADFALIASLTPDELQSHISVHGLQHLDALRILDLGGILAVPHMPPGTWVHRLRACSATTWRLSSTASPGNDSLGSAGASCRGVSVAVAAEPLSESAANGQDAKSTSGGKGQA
jgi:hypothetical protein